MRNLPLSLSLCVAMALAACGKKEESAPVAAPAASTPAASAPAASTPAPTPAAEPAAPATASASGIGVAECDDFLAKYEACLADKVPESARAALQQSLEATRSGWKQAMATPGGADALKTACIQMRDTSRASLQAYGCTDF